MSRHWIIIAIIVCALSLVLYQLDPGDDDPTDGTDDSGNDGSIDASSDNETGTTAGNNLTGQISENVVQIWARAIQEFEGRLPTNRNMRDNNPGNLEEQGDAGKDGPYARFSTFAAGEAALVADLTAKLAKYPGYTILQIMSRYSKTDQVPYANFVANAFSQSLGQNVTTDMTLNDLQNLGGTS